MKPKLLVSACLLGTPCRYDGKSKKNEAVCALAERFELIPVCPEVLGGLPLFRSYKYVRWRRRSARASSPPCSRNAARAAAAAKFTTARLPARSPPETA